MAENLQRGLVRLAGGTQATRVADDAGLFQLPSTGMADAARGVAREFEALGTHVGKLADHAAAVEGRDAGHLAGLDPEFRPTKLQTIRGEAFDKAGLHTYLAKTRVSVQQDIDDAAEKHAGDPGKLGQMLAQKRAGWLQQVPVELRPEIETLFAAGTRTAMRTATREMWRRQSEDQRASLQTELQTSLRSIHQRAYQLGLDAEADDILAVDVTKLEGALARKGPNGQRLVGPAQAAKLVADAKEEVARARLFGAFDRLPSPEAKARLLDQLDKEFADGKGVAKAFDLQTYRSVRHQLEASLRSDMTQRRSAANAIMTELRTVGRWAADGNQPRPEHLAALKARIASEAPELQPALSSALRLVDEAKALRQMTPEELDGTVRTIRGQIKKYGVTEQSEAYLKMSEGMLGAMRTGLKTDPLGWAEKVELLKVAPFDPGRPETFAPRIAQAEAIAQRYGQKPQYLRPEERRRLETVLAKGGNEAIAVASAIANGAPEQAAAILGELDKKHAGHLALLGNLVRTNADPQFIQLAANGLAFAQLPEKKRIADIKPADVAAAADDVAGTALGGLPQSRSAAIALTNYAYEMVAQQKGLRTFDAQEWKRLFRQSLGETDVGGVTYGGVTHQRRGWLGGRQDLVVVPPNVKADGFGELLDSIRQPDLVDGMGNGPRHGNGAAASAAEIRRATLLQAGPARYYLATGVDERQRPRVLLDGAGDPYVLDLKKLEPELRRRRPDLYLGGR